MTSDHLPISRAERHSDELAHTTSEWAARQTGLTPDARLLLTLLAFDIDKGERGATRDRLGVRAGMDRDTRHRAIRELEAKGLIEAVDFESIADDYCGSGKRTRSVALYAPKGVQK